VNERDGIHNMRAVRSIMLAKQVQITKPAREIAQLEIYANYQRYTLRNTPPLLESWF
jgi:hypothetical protein